MMSRTASLVGFVLFGAALAQQEPTNATGDLDVAKLRTQVLQDDTFKRKVVNMCQLSHTQDACEKRAGNALFCKLLQRSNPVAAKANCDAHGASLLQAPAAAAPAGNMDEIKTRIMGSKDFKQQTEKVASAMGCSSVKKAKVCASFVNEAAFCLAFADQMSRFANMRGLQSEEEYCKHVDEKVPELALLLQKKSPARFIQVRSNLRRKLQAPEDDLAKEMTHDLEMNFNKIAPFGKEDTAKELQDHAAKTQDTLVDAVENAEVAEIKRAVFRALTRLRAATIKEFDTIARLETQAIDAYNDAHHYRAENPLAHLHEDEAPVETDKLKSFH
mmetsp:Transcript_144603/g.252098  ORF Transcript_144603/g.252098 Transcript_144603/m.252098 type:complete len:330 (-) Transcript_144603:137-1126(-)